MLSMTDCRILSHRFISNQKRAGVLEHSSSLNGWEFTRLSHRTVAKNIILCEELIYPCFAPPHSTLSMLVN